MLAWSSVGKLAVSLFYRRWNEIDIYIEDTGHTTKAVYKNLLNRILNARFKIIEIFPIGNREKVIEESKKDAYSSRKTLFIIDGDLDVILAGPHDGGPTLFRLKKYCIENYLIDFNSFPIIVCEDCCDLTEIQVINDLKVRDWQSANEILSRRIYVLFCLLRIFYPSDRSISLRLGPFILNQTGNLSEEKVTLFESQKLAEIVRDFGEVYLLENKARIESKIDLEGFTMLDYCSGKDFLFPLLNLYIRSKFPIKCNGDSLKVRLSKICDTDNLMDLHDFV